MIDLHVDGDVGQVRDAARLMSDTVPDRLDAAADAAARGRSAGWTGDAGAAYRSTARDVGTGADLVARASRQVGSRLRELAEQLDDLKDDMLRFAGEARAADLDVNDEVIEDPGGPVPDPGELPPDADPQLREQHGRLAQAHDEQAERIREYRRLEKEVEKRFEKHTRWVEANLGSLPGLVDAALEETPSVVLKLTSAGVDSAFRNYRESLEAKAREIETDQVQRELERSKEDRSVREAREEARQRRRIEALGKDGAASADAARALRKAFDLLDKGPLNALDLATGTPLAKLLAEEAGTAAAVRGLLALGLLSNPLSLGGIAVGLGGGVVAGELWERLPESVKDKLSLGRLIEGLGSDDGPDSGGSGGSERPQGSASPTPTPGPSGTPAPGGSGGSGGSGGTAGEEQFSRPSPYDGDRGIIRPTKPREEPQFSRPFTQEGTQGAVSA